jgi:hypothetical protein
MYEIKLDADMRILGNKSKESGYYCVRNNHIQQVCEGDEVSLITFSYTTE